MSADQKIEETEYFLEKITQATTRRDFVPNLSAFLSHARSVADYLLEDYNEKLGLNIPLSKKLFISTFKNEANNQNNQSARNFITYYETEFNKLLKDPIGSLLMTKRNIEVHRTDVPVQVKFNREISETISITDSISIEVRDKNGNLKTRSEPTSLENKPVSQNKPISHSVEWFFTDFKNDDVITVCSKFLDLMKSFVSDIRTSH